MKPTDEGRARLLVAASAQQQLAEAARLLALAESNLAALRHGIAPALAAARNALESARKAHACTEQMIERIP